MAKRAPKKRNAKSRRSTRPRRSSAKIAQQRVKRSPRSRSGRATRVKRAEQKPSVKRGRFILLVALMASLGFVTVYAADTALSSFAHLEEQGTSLWDKLVDRMLDRDIPRVGEPAKKKPAEKPKPAKKPTPVAKKKPAEKPKVERLPAVPVPDKPRAELETPSPEAYADDVKVAPAPAPAPAATPEDPRARIDAILDRVGLKARD